MIPRIELRVDLHGSLNQGYPSRTNCRRDNRRFCRAPPLSGHPLRRADRLMFPLRTAFRAQFARIHCPSSAEVPSGFPIAPGRDRRQATRFECQQLSPVHFASHANIGPGHSPIPCKSLGGRPRHLPARYRAPQQTCWWYDLGERPSRRAFSAAESGSWAAEWLLKGLDTGRRIILNDIASIRKAMNLSQGAAARDCKAKLQLYRIDDENEPE